MYKCIIVGAGPSGIAMGAELVASGIDPNEFFICEKSDHHSASIRQFYPVNKDINAVYKNIVLDIEGVVGFSGLISVDQYYKMMEDIIKTYSLIIKTNTEVQKVVKEHDEFILYTTAGEYRAESVVLASGVFAKPRKPDYPIPAKLLSKISYDILKLQKESQSNADILVVGGGDSASEYAQILAQMGNKVTMSYRQDHFFRMNDLNQQRLMALKEENKVDIFFGTNIISLEEIDEKIKVNFSEKDAVFVDYIVYSLGGASPSAFMHNCGLYYDDTNVLLKEYKETNIDKLFMIGDLAAGRKGGSLMFAFNGARDVAIGLHNKYDFPEPKVIS